MSESTGESNAGLAEGYLLECEAENKRLRTALERIARGATLTMDEVVWDLRRNGPAKLSEQVIAMYALDKHKAGSRNVT